MKARALLTAALLLGATSSAFAGYTIARTDGGSNTLVQGREYGFILTSNPPLFENVRLLASGGPGYQITVGPGVQKGPNEYKPDASGQILFVLRVDGTPSLQLTAQNTQLPEVFTTLALTIQKYPVTFAITPPSPTVDANVPFNIEIKALDSLGQWVTAFEDAVQIRDQQLGEITGVLGTQFVGGVANVSVNIKAGDMNNQTRLTLTGLTQYFDPLLPSPHLAPAPSYTSNLINVRPGAFDKLIMLFPGEVLNPGIGKDSANIVPQTAGIKVSEVQIWRVDSFFNPILTSVPTTISFNSSNPSDTPPANRSMTTPPLRVLGVAVDPFIFPSNGNRTITATPDGDGTKADTSNVPVNPGAVSTYQFTLQPGPIYTTDDIIQVRITAYDGVGALLTTLNGPLVGAQIAARLEPSGDERVDWVDTNPITDIPDNVISFNSGVATINLSVTKRATRVKLHFLDQFLVGALSDEFEVRIGAPNRVHMTILGIAGANPLVGEIYTPGTYPGNSGLPPTVTAGQNVIVEARITDRRFNLYSDVTINNTPVQLNGENAANFIVSSHPQGANVTFDSSGELKYVVGFDESFRVHFRTAGPTQRIRAVTTIGTGEFLSSPIAVLPGAYNRMVLQAPGETLRPGTNLEADGKDGAPTSRQAGVAFTATAFATDQYFNPVSNGPYPEVDFLLTPGGANNFVSGTLPAQMQSGARNFSVTLSTDSTVRVSDTAIPARNQTVAIPVGHGVLHHFRMTLSTLNNKIAGVPFGVTIRAEDEFDNVVASFNQTVNLVPTTGATTMSPSSVNLTNGVFTGDLTMFAAGVGIKINMSYSSINTDSPAITVLVNDQGYRRLLLLMPGETIAPGTVAGKTGSPTPVTVGLVSVIRAIACDLYYNPLDATSNVQLVSNRYAQFGSASGALANVDGHGEFSTTLILRTAGVHTVTLSDLNQPGTVSSSSSAINGLVGTYRKLQLLAPGEVADPGTFVPTGKTAAAPSAQRAGVPFTMTIRAVDDFWNLVSFNGGDIQLDANTSSVLYNPPNNADTPGLDPRPFTNGSATREVILGQQGIFQITATDRDNLTKPGQTVELSLDPGPVYVIDTASNVVAGQPFTIQVRLEEGGVPLAGYNETIHLTATLAGGGNASGAFNPDGSPRSYNMTNGVADITDLVYAHVERIKIRVGDNFSRVAFSNDIEVAPSGLKYRINVPAQGIAGPPSSFQVSVELLEQNTNTLVKNHDHEVLVNVLSAMNPTTDGQFSVVSANLVQGVVTFQQTYTKAESIIIQISESNTAGEPNFVIPARNSNNINIKADGYKKLAIIAPGETHQPGVPSATGKTGTPFTRQVGVPFLVQVRGVDQYWNVANEFNGGQIRLTSDDSPASINATNPTNQNAPLINGEVASEITIFNPGDTNVSVRDNSNPLIGIQSVRVTVGGNVYEVIVPAQEFAGPPTTFTMNVTLKDSITGNVVTGANHTVDLTPMLPDGTPASGNLGVKEGTIVAGTLNIPNQSYSISENIFIRVTERTQNTIRNVGNSPVIRFIPRQVRYTISLPTEAEVNVPFQVVIRTIDQDTGTEVKNLNRSNDLEVYSTLTGLPATGVFVPSGANAVNIVNGVAVLSASYNTAETIFLRLIDNTPGAQPSSPTQAIFVSSTSVNVRPGPMASVDLADFALQSNEVRNEILIARDATNNPIPNQMIIIRVQGFDPTKRISMNGSINEYQARTDSNGQLPIEFTPLPDSNGEIVLVITDGDRPERGFSKLVRVDVMGLGRAPRRAFGIGEDRIPVGSVVKLDLQNLSTTNGGVMQTFWRMDGGAYQLYDPNVGITGFTETKTYNVEWYSQVCYPAVDPTCSNPVRELSISGAPNFQAFATYLVEEKLNGYPSPFNPKAAGINYLTIQYPLTTASSVEIDIYDLFGQRVWHTSVPAGAEGGIAKSDNRVFWYGVNDDGTTVANGGYVVRVKVGATGQTMKTKVLVVK